MNYVVNHKGNMISFEEYLDAKEAEAATMPKATKKLTEVKKGLSKEEGYQVKYNNKLMDFEQYLALKEEEAVQCFTKFTVTRKKAI